MQTTQKTHKIRKRATNIEHAQKSRKILLLCVFYVNQVSLDKLTCLECVTVCGFVHDAPGCNMLLGVMGEKVRLPHTNSPGISQ